MAWRPPVRRNIDWTEQIPDIDVTALEPSSPVVYPDMIEPLEEHALQQYVADLKMMSKRKRDLQPVIDRKRAELESLNNEIRFLETYVNDLRESFCTFPRMLLTSKVAAAQESLIAAVAERIDKYMPGANFRRTCIDNEVHDLTTHLIEMNRAIAAAAVEPIPKNMCPICTDAPLEYVCDPCGHMFCGKCIKNDPYQRRCAMCRGIVPKVIRVYFSL